MFIIIIMIMIIIINKKKNKIMQQKRTHTHTHTYTYTIGSGLTKSKEFEDIFEDIESELADVFFKAQFTKDEVSKFFAIVIVEFHNLMKKWNGPESQRKRISSKYKKQT